MKIESPEQFRSVLIGMRDKIVLGGMELHNIDDKRAEIADEARDLADQAVTAWDAGDKIAAYVILKKVQMMLREIVAEGKETP